jgi:sugar phosphate isomerase/epimerase
MRIAICNELFDGMEQPAVFETAASLGYDGVEMAPFTLGAEPTALQLGQRETLRTAAERAGVEIIGLHWLLARTRGLHLTSRDTETRRRTSAYLDHLIELCADLGGTLMVFGSPQQRDLEKGMSLGEGIELAAQVFQSAMARAEERKVTICFEPLAPAETNFINTAAEARELIEKVNHPNFRLHLDVKAMSAEGTPVPEIITRNARYVRHFHANDATGGAPGSGKSDFRPILAALKRSGYGGYLSVEVFDTKPDAETVASRSIAYLRSCLKDVEGD